MIRRRYTIERGIDGDPDAYVTWPHFVTDEDDGTEVAARQAVPAAIVRTLGVARAAIPGGYEPKDPDPDVYPPEVLEVWE